MASPDSWPLRCCPPSPRAAEADELVVVAAVVVEEEFPFVAIAAYSGCRRPSFQDQHQGFGSLYDGDAQLIAIMKRKHEKIDLLYFMYVYM